MGFKTKAYFSRKGHDWNQLVWKFKGFNFKSTFRNQACLKTGKKILREI